MSSKIYCKLKSPVLWHVLTTNLTAQVTPFEFGYSVSDMYNSGFVHTCIRSVGFLYGHVKEIREFFTVEVGSPQLLPPVCAGTINRGHNLGPYFSVFRVIFHLGESYRNYLYGNGFFN